MNEKTSSTIRFFSHNDFYSVHGEDATFAYESMSSAGIIKYMNSEPKLSYFTLNKGNFEKFVRELLLVRNYKVEVYVKSTDGDSEWNLEYKGSPGNLSQFEDILYDVSDNIVVDSVTMGIKLIKNISNNLAQTVAVCFVNTTENTFTLGEIAVNENFSEIETLIAQNTPKECVIQSGNLERLNNLHETLTRNGVAAIRHKATDFNGQTVEQDLNRLLYFSENQVRSAASFKEINLTEALGALQAVINYLNLISDEQNFNQYKFTSLDLLKYVRLDNAALVALNILPRQDVANHNKNDSVFGVLDHCHTVQGKRLLQQWLKQPLRDINLINERQDVVETIYNNSEMRNTLSSNCLPHIPDLLLLAKKLGAQKASLRDCYCIYQAIDSMSKIVYTLKMEKNASMNGELIDPMCETLNYMDKYQLMIESTLDMKLAEKGEFFVNPSYNEDLIEVHEKIYKIKEKMQNLLDKCTDELGYDSGKTIKLEKSDQHGHYFKVTLKEEKALRDSKRFEIIDVVKGGVRFTNDSLKKLNESYTELREIYEESQKNVVQEMLQIAAGYANELKHLNACIAKLDVYVSLAEAAAAAPIPYVRPKLLEEGSGKITLIKARHPCLEKQEAISYIPNNVEFSKDEKMLYIITGPNMGGKSTYMRSVGICVFLAQIGSLLPCESAVISIVDGIYCRVGAEDSDAKGLSTFMVEMVETRSIIKCATSNSLVIIDELGRGTSTYDGCGIAYAIAEHLASNLRCFTLFATHFHEITGLEEEMPAVQNCHVTAVITENEITPLYQIREGPCDKSYGIHCAKMLNFSEDVIQGAIAEQRRLEDADGMKYIKDFEPALKRKEIDEGDTLIKSVMEKCLALDVANLSDEELLSAVNNMKKELESSENLFVKGLISN